MAEKLQTITELRRHVASLLSVLWQQPEAEAMASVIIGEYTGMGSARQLAFGDQITDRTTAARILSATARAAKGEPLQYIFGYTEFLGHRIEVETGVLIPRPETEELTSLIISENQGFNGVATDICTGSGCIAIALSLAFPGATVYASDISQTALNIASRNIISNKAGVTLIAHDILSQPVDAIEKSTIIVSNPPYITVSEKEMMHVNVVDYEPHEALFVPDNDPLLFYRHLVKIADKRLLPGGRIYLEANEAYAVETSRLFNPSCYREVKVLNDIRGKQRFIKAVKYG
ncbi:MAG: peptide chain release factor N(5)-glutamine methyltransferase [Bacteroidales bacterium]|jgi:release factor glutamine methyltransferase|nr:peptide chain release factor N(5)-glutamine methyltransferase [Bacteroidales bacterium]